MRAPKGLSRWPGKRRPGIHRSVARRPKTAKTRGICSTEWVVSRDLTGTRSSTMGIMPQWACPVIRYYLRVCIPNESFDPQDNEAGRRTNVGCLTTGAPCTATASRPAIDSTHEQCNKAQYNAICFSPRYFRRLNAKHTNLHPEPASQSRSNMWQCTCRCQQHARPRRLPLCPARRQIPSTVAADSGPGSNSPVVTLNAILHFASRVSGHSPLLSMSFSLFVNGLAAACE